MANNVQTKMRENPAIQNMPRSPREWTNFVKELTTVITPIFEVTSAYTVTNDAEDRSWDANAAAGSITNPPTQAEVENLRDAVLELSDVVATLVSDLQSKGLLE
jgi:hypothetical protein